MNVQPLLNNEHFLDSDSNDVFDELIDHIGNLLAQEYFQIMEDKSHIHNDAKRLPEN